MTKFLYDAGGLWSWSGELMEEQQREEAGRGFVCCCHRFLEQQESGKQIENKTYCDFICVVADFDSLINIARTTVDQINTITWFLLSKRSFLLLNKADGEMSLSDKIPFIAT
jgi:hypothetical protein